MVVILIRLSSESTPKMEKIFTIFEPNKVLMLSA
jgi:hypothetical protein